MDDLDLAILREISRGRIMWWGSSDPRLSTREVARRLKVDPTTVWARLQRWERIGFVRGYSVVPHPHLFGARLAGGGLRVEDPRAKPRILEDLGLLEGSAFAVDQVGPWLVVMFVYESERQLARGTQLTRRLSGVAEVEECVPFHAPEPSVVPSRSDWKILGALHDHPRSTISAIAKAAHLSVRTFSRRYDALVRANAIWSIPLLDFTRYEGATIARFVIVVNRGSDTHRIETALARKFPSYVMLEDQSPIVDKERVPLDLLSLMVHLGSAGAVEDVESEIRALPDVQDVQVYFPRRLYVYDHWFEERLNEKIAAG